MEGSFTSKTGGGNCTFSSFMLNPQYRLVVHPPLGQQDRLQQNKAKITITLRTNKDIPVNVAMVWSQGRRVTECVRLSPFSFQLLSNVLRLSAKDMVATSGPYTYGLARLAKTITGSSNPFTRHNKLAQRGLQRESILLSLRHLNHTIWAHFHWV